MANANNYQSVNVGKVTDKEGNLIGWGAKTQNLWLAAWLRLNGLQELNIQVVDASRAMGEFFIYKTAGDTQTLESLEMEFVSLLNDYRQGRSFLNGFTMDEVRVEIKELKGRLKDKINENRR